MCGFESLREHQEVKHTLLQNITIVNNFTTEGIGNETIDRIDIIFYTSNTNSDRSGILPSDPNMDVNVTRSSGNTDGSKQELKERT